jgi:hypothetical protein
LRALANQLQARGRTALYGAADTYLGVLSVASGVTVWTDGETLWWQAGAGEVRWPVTDPDGAAQALLSLAEDGR